MQLAVNMLCPMLLKLLFIPRDKQIDKCATDAQSTVILLAALYTIVMPTEVNTNSTLAPCHRNNGDKAGIQGYDMQSMQIAQVSNSNLALECTWHNLVFHVLHDDIPFLSLLWCLCWQLFVQEARLHNSQRSPQNTRILCSIHKTVCVEKQAVVHPVTTILYKCQFSTRLQHTPPQTTAQAGNPLDCSSHI